MKSLLESIPWTKTVENPRNPKENEYPEENGWYITMLDCNEHEILVNRFEKGDSGWSFYNKTHVKWWMPLTDELKHGIAELVDMITEDYVSFEIAKLLKEKGFDVPCIGRYSVRSKKFHLDCTRLCNNGGLFEFSAQLFKWR